MTNNPNLPEYWASHSPDHPAIVDGDQVLTYGEWNDLANRLADSLDELGLTSPRVCVRTRIRKEWFVIYLALGKLGWEQVSLNWRLTTRETREILADSKPGAFFFDDTDPAPLISACADPSIRLISVTTPVSNAEEYTALVAKPDPTQRLSNKRKTLITYSSGTTGKPKGVRKEQPTDEAGRKRASEWAGSADVKGTRGENRTLQTLPLHHGAGPRSSRLCHRAGGTLYLLDPFDPVRALEIIDRERITHWKTVPTMLQRVRALPAETLSSFDVSSIVSVSTGAAPTPLPLRRWVASYFGPVLSVGYGMSETGIVANMGPGMQRKKPESCGKVRPHAGVRVIGPDGSEVPRGTEGELYVRTPMTISGYFNKDPLSAELMTEDGFFRTGDVGRLDEDNYLYITGRMKDMIIAGGVNIFPAEIEQAIIEHSAVVDAAVIGIPEETFGEQVMAFCEMRADSNVTAGELLGFLAERLAPFKRPRRIEFVTELPRNSMGKVLKHELREPFWKDRGSVI
jgi:long-chain acyl-CoA synthetase